MLVVSRDRLKEDDSRSVVVLLTADELARLLAQGPGQGIQQTTEAGGAPLTITIAHSDGGES